MRNLWLALAAVISLSTGSLFANDEPTTPSTEVPAPVAAEEAPQAETSNK